MITDTSFWCFQTINQKISLPKQALSSTTHFCLGMRLATGAPVVLWQKKTTQCNHKNWECFFSFSSKNLTLTSIFNFQKNPFFTQDCGRFKNGLKLGGKCCQPKFVKGICVSVAWCGFKIAKIFEIWQPENFILHVERKGKICPLPLVFPPLWASPPLPPWAFPLPLASLLLVQLLPLASGQLCTSLQFPTSTQQQNSLACRSSQTTWEKIWGHHARGDCTPIHSSKRGTQSWFPDS